MRSSHYCPLDAENTVEISGQGSWIMFEARAASDIISALREDLDGRTTDAIAGILRSQFARSHVEISEDELLRVADDISHSPALQPSSGFR